MFDIFRNRLEITGTLSTVTALRIGAGSDPEPTGSDLPVIKDALDQPYIPGSSFKGAMRSRLESFLRGILGSDRSMVANPANNDEWSITSSEIKELQEQYSNDETLTNAIIEQTDLISRLFGSPWLASKFQVRDLTVVAEDWFGQYQERDGVAINRDTEIAADGKLYDFQVVPAGTSFEFKAVVENAEEWELGLLVIGLHQFESEQIPLGGGSSRGLGVVKLETKQMKWFDYPKDQPDLLLEYLQKLVKNDASAYEDATDFKDRWVSELMSHLRQKISDRVNS